MKSFPKIWALGNKYIADIFDFDVEITEKIDGSQFIFGRNKEGKFVCRSKGVMIEPDSPNDMFRPVVEWAREASEKIGRDVVLYGETLKSPKHNTLKYDRIPRNHFALFGTSDFDGTMFVSSHDELLATANIIECDVVPLLFKGKANFGIVNDLLHKESALGGVNAEGVVVKAYEPYFMGSMHIPLRAGKFVTEAFKEKHSSNPEYISGKSKVAQLFQDYCTEARWEKAVQHLRDSDLLVHDPKDIGALLKEVNQDVTEECKEELKEALWKIYKKDFLRTASRGLPEWYKRKLAMG